LLRAETFKKMTTCHDCFAVKTWLLKSSVDHHRRPSIYCALPLLYNASLYQAVCIHSTGIICTSIPLRCDTRRRKAQCVSWDSFIGGWNLLQKGAHHAQFLHVSDHITCGIGVWYSRSLSVCVCNSVLLITKSHKRAQRAKMLRLEAVLRIPPCSAAVQMCDVRGPASVGSMYDSFSSSGAVFLTNVSALCISKSTRETLRKHNVSLDCCP